MMPHLSKGVLILCVQVHRHGFWAIINPPVSFFVWQVKVIFIDSMSHKDYTGKRNAKWKRWLNKHEIIVPKNPGKTTQWGFSTDPGWPWSLGTSYIQSPSLEFCLWFVRFQLYASVYWTRRDAFIVKHQQSFLSRSGKTVFLQCCL